MSPFYGMTHMDVLTVSYVWSIVNFSFLDTMPRDQKIRSEIFNNANDPYIKWYMTVYPSGVKYYERYIAVYLCFKMAEDYAGEITTKVRMYALDNKKNKVSNYRYDRVMVENLECWGYHDFIERKDVALHKEKMTPGDTFTLGCEISYVRNITKKVAPTVRSQQTIEQSCPKPNAPNALYEDHLLSDVVLLNHGKEFHAHKAILASRSPIFQGMFLSKPGIELYRVEIPDLKQEVVTEMLRFIYTNEVKNITNLVLDLLVAADAYRLEDLKLLCSRELFKSITVKDAPDFLVIADKYRSDFLKDKLKDYMIDNKNKIMNTTQFKTFNQSHPHLADWALGRNININKNKNIVFGRTK